MAQLYQDNFDATAAASLPSGWTNVSGNWQVSTAPPASGHTKSFTDTSIKDGDVALQTGVTASADMEMLYSFVVPSTAGGTAFPGMGAVLRSTSTFGNAYLMLLDGGLTPKILLFKRVGGSFTQLGTNIAGGTTFAVGDKVMVRARIQGTTIQARIWKSTATEPTTYALSTTDTAVTAAGYAGFYYGVDGATSPVVGATDMYVSDATTAAGAAVAAATAYTLTGSSSGTSGSPSSAFTVQASGSLSAAVAVTPSDGGNGGTFSPATVTLAAGTNPSATFTYTPASTGAKSISTTNNGSLTNPAALTYTANAAGAVTPGAPNDPATVYSPGNWNVIAAGATTVNAGAYLSTFTSSASITLNFDVSNNAAPLSQIEYRIDGRDPWIMAPVASTVVCTMPSDTTAAPFHLLEMRVKSTSETVNRWNAPSASAVKFTGLTLASGGTTLAPGSAPGGKILILGDSIDEGVRTINSTASNDTDRNSAAMGWAYKLRDLLGVEVGVIGFGGSGLTVVGSGNVPALPSTFNMMYAGQARTPDTSTALIAINIGTNDQSATASAVTSGMVATLNGLLSAYPSTPIALMRPFGGYQASALQAAIAQCSAPSRVTWIDTTGFLNTSYGIDGTGYHPTGPNDLAVIAPQVAAKLRPLLLPSTAAQRFVSSLH